MSGINLNKITKSHTKNAQKDPANTSWLNKDIKLFESSFGDKAKEGFYLEISILLGAGVNIKEALELIEQEQKKAKFKELINNIKEKIVAGASLSEALESHHYFSAYEYHTVQIGEETGQLDRVLLQLSDYYKSKIKQKRQIIHAISYPLLILGSSIGAVTFMLSFIVPMFKDIFKRFGGKLPAITQFIIDLSAWLGQYGPWLMGIGLVVGYALWYNRKKTMIKRYGSWMLQRIPVIGPLAIRLHLARFCGSLGLLIGSKIPLLRAIELVEKMITFFPLEQALKTIANDILHGDNLHVSMEKFKLFDPRMIALIKVGEEVNKLDEFFERLATQYSEEAENQTGMLNTFLEPLMIIFLGLIVGFILVAMYMPMFQLSTNFGG